MSDKSKNMIHALAYACTRHGRFFISGFVVIYKSYVLRAACSSDPFFLYARPFPFPFGALTPASCSKYFFMTNA